LGLGTAVATCYGKYADFQGRARRSEYWFFYLFNVLIFTAFFILMGLAGSTNDTTSPNRPLAAVVGIAFLLFVLASILPHLAVAVRRLHDTGRSGWWYLIALVPFVGGIILLVFLCLGGTHGPNEFGPDPMADPSEVFA
jgi:uncharacterized membrane protein YhaH (DUF805 family)